MVAITPAGPCDVSSNGLTGGVIAIEDLVIFSPKHTIVFELKNI
jgi:hypothetical protein